MIARLGERIAPTATDLSFQTGRNRDEPDRTKPVATLLVGPAARR